MVKIKKTFLYKIGIGFLFIGFYNSCSSLERAEFKALTQDKIDFTFEEVTRSKRYSMGKMTYSVTNPELNEYLGLKVTVSNKSNETQRIDLSKTVLIVKNPKGEAQEVKFDNITSGTTGGLVLIFENTKTPALSASDSVTRYIYYLIKTSDKAEHLKLTGNGDMIVPIPISK